MRDEIMSIFYLKALHIIGFVAWFAGLFYLVRIFVYHAEAADKAEPARSILLKEFGLMQGRVYKIICNPAMMITWSAGIGMLIINPGYLEQGWMHVKLLLLVGLLGYHLYCKKIIRQLAKGESSLTSFQFRLLNEVPTLFLVAIVLLAVLRSTENFLYGIAGLIAFAAVLYFSAKAYKKHRERQEAKKS